MPTVSDRAFVKVLSYYTCPQWAIRSRSFVKKFCHEAALWRRLNHENVTSVFGVTMDPYQVVFDRVSDKDIAQYTLDLGVNRASLVSFVSDSLQISPRLANAFSQVSGVAEGLGYLHSQNVIHGRLRGVSRQLVYLRQESQLIASGRQPSWSTTMVGLC